MSNPMQSYNMCTSKGASASNSSSSDSSNSTNSLNMNKTGPLLTSNFHPGGDSGTSTGYAPYPSLTMKLPAVSSAAMAPQPSLNAVSAQSHTYDLNGNSAHYNFHHGLEGLGGLNASALNASMAFLTPKPLPAGAPAAAAMVAQQDFQMGTAAPSPAPSAPAAVPTATCTNAYAGRAACQTSSPGTTAAAAAAAAAAPARPASASTANPKKRRQSHQPPQQHKEKKASAAQSTVSATSSTTAAGSAGKQVAGKKRKHKSGWRKPSDKPKRPLSAYNIFFQHEREKIVAAAESPNVPITSIGTDTRGVTADAIATAVYSGVDNNDNKADANASSSAQASRSSTTPAVASTVLTLQRIIQRSRGQTKASADRHRSNRSHTKTHGKISFVDLAKTVAKKWKELDPASKAVYVALADMERGIYRKKVEDWERKKKAEAAGAVASGATPSATAEVAATCVKAQVSTTATSARVAKKAKAADDENRERMRRILENASRHGSVHNTSNSSSSDDDDDDDDDLFGAPARPQAAAATNLATSGAGPSISQIASYVYGMHQQVQLSKNQQQQAQAIPTPVGGMNPTGANDMLSRIMSKSSGQNKARKPKRARTDRRVIPPPSQTNAAANTSITPLVSAAATTPSLFTVPAPNVVAGPGHSPPIHRGKICSCSSKLDEMLAEMHGMPGMNDKPDKHHHQQGLKEDCNGFLHHDEVIGGGVNMPGMSNAMDDAFLDLVDHIPELTSTLHPSATSVLSHGNSAPPTAQQQQDHSQASSTNPLLHCHSMPAPSTSHQNHALSAPVAAADHCNIVQPPAGSARCRPFGDSAETTAQGLSASDALFDPLHIHAETTGHQHDDFQPAPLAMHPGGGIRHAQPYHEHHPSEHGLDEFLKWAFEHGMEE